MLRFVLALGFTLAIWATQAQAQTNVLVNDVTGSTNTGALITAPIGPGNPLPVALTTFSPSARHFPGCTVGASSASCLAAGTAQTYLAIQNTSTGNTVACTFGGTAVLNSSTSIQLAPGQGASWGPNTAGVPSGALTCIASGASTPLYVEWN